MPKQRKNTMRTFVKESFKAHESRDHNFFVKNMPFNTHWRAYNDFKEKCCFLDIETTGLDRYNDEVTVIGVYNGKDSKFFINGKNLDDFSREMEKYSMIITFNGLCFDVPFLKAKFPSINFNKFHIDLRFAMKSIGYNGGLKAIEKSLGPKLGISRDCNIQDVDGLEAVRLWYNYRRGDKEALDKLVSYNQADIENLKALMEFAFEKLKEREFINVLT